MEIPSAILRHLHSRHCPRCHAVKKGAGHLKKGAINGASVVSEDRNPNSKDIGKSWLPYEYYGHIFFDMGIFFFRISMGNGGMVPSGVICGE